MKHLLTCCELPKCMLEYEDTLNDYDFVLYHQYLKDETYRNNYLNKRKTHPDRMMILDNSAYEFFVSGEKFIEEDFIRVIKELKPTYYIVPDVLMDYQKTFENFMRWIEIVPTISDSQPYFVPQGRTFDEFMDCAARMSSLIRFNNLPKNFCIPFHNDFFLDRNKLYSTKIKRLIFRRRELTKDEEYAYGRIVLMDKLTSLYPNYTFHMLGSHNPIEIMYYDIFDNIISFDSGYPVKLAISGIKLGEEKEKPNVIIDDFYGTNLSDSVKELIIYNVNEMRDLI